MRLIPTVDGAMSPDAWMVCSLEQCDRRDFPYTVLMQRLPPRADGSALATDGLDASSGTTSRVWYRAVLSDGLVGMQHLPMVREHFADAVGAADWPDGACLVLSGQSIFFSPAAISAVPHLIVACGAEPSPPPGRSGASLLVGRESDWQLLPHELH
jgi:hypothetical protein